MKLGIALKLGAAGLLGILMVGGMVANQMSSLSAIHDVDERIARREMAITLTGETEIAIRRTQIGVRDVMLANSPEEVEKASADIAKYAEEARSQAKAGHDVVVTQANKDLFTKVGQLSGAYATEGQTLVALSKDFFATQAKRSAVTPIIQKELSTLATAVKASEQPNKSDTLAKISDFNAQYNNLRTETYKYMAVKDPASLPKIAAALDATSAELDRLKALVDQKGQANISAVAAQMATFRELTEVINKIQAERDNVVKKRGAPLVAALTESVNTIQTTTAKLIEEGKAEANQTMSAANQWGMGLGLLAIAVLIGSALYSIFGIARPIARITGSMDAMSKGDLAVKVEGGNRSDEIGDQARVLEVFRGGLQENERMRADQARQEQINAEKMVTERNKMADEFQSTMGAIADKFVSSSNEVADAARNLAATAEETARQAQVVQGAAEEASSNVQTVAAGAEELTASIREINEQVTRSARIASEAAEEASRTENNVRLLTEAAVRIGDVVNLIKDIAEQTNLLALNATIEAARAGEAGRGFAVVASEVKQLAAQTAKATDEIGQKIGEIQSATNDTVSSISRITNTIGTIREVTNSIASAVEEQGAATGEIASNTQRAAEGTQSVTGNITGVGQAAEMTGTASTQLMQLSDGLQAQSAGLQKEVTDFVRGLRRAS